MKELPIVGNPEKSKEEFVRHAFSKYADQLGFRICNIQKKFPDCTAIDMRNNRYQEVYIEFEYTAKNFINHGHINQMEEGKEYIVICWLSTGMDILISQNIKVICLSDNPKIKVIPPEVLKRTYNKNYNILYRAMAFNSNFIYGKSINIFNDVSLFVTNNTLKDDLLPIDSIIVLFEKNYFVGEFTVVSYHKLDREPSSQYEKDLYNILSYPVTFVNDMANEHRFFKSYIGFKDFKKYNPIPCAIINKKLSHGVTNLSFEDYQIIIGQRKSPVMN